jgi:hypothetical protein
MILLAILFAASQSGEGNLARQNPLGKTRSATAASLVTRDCADDLWISLPVA